MHRSPLLRIVAIGAALAVPAVGCAEAPPSDQPATLAIAYSDMDGEEGFEPTGADELISMLIDSNRDGVVSEGDSIVTDRYPLDPEATAFGDFEATTHRVEEVIYALPLFVHVHVDGGASIWYSLGEPMLPRDEPFEQYIETSADHLSWVQAIDLHPGAGNQGSVDFLSIRGNPPSLPGHDLWESRDSSEDDPFVDVEIFIESEPR